MRYWQLTLSLRIVSRLSALFFLFPKVSGYFLMQQLLAYLKMRNQQAAILTGPLTFVQKIEGRQHQIPYKQSIIKLLSGCLFISKMFIRKLVFQVQKLLNIIQAILLFRLPKMNSINQIRFNQLFKINDYQFKFITNITSHQFTDKAKMFQDLTKHIQKQNLQKIKHKNRYINEQNQNEKYTKHFTNQRQRSSSSKHSDESISNYELKERQEVFNNLMNLQQQLQHGQYNQQFILESHRWKYFTPENKIKQLQRQLQLSSQKRKIQEEVRLRQLTHIKQDYQRKIEAMKIQVQIMKVKQTLVKRDQELVKQLRKQNLNLKELLDRTQHKCQGIQSQLKQYKNGKNDKQSLLLQIKNLKSLALYKKECSNQNQNQNPNIKQNQKYQMIELYKTQIKSVNQANNHLKRKCQELQSDLFQHKLKNDKITQAFEEYQRKMKTDNQKLLLETEKLKTQKQRLQKSLMDTMSQFSNHLHQMTQQSLRQSTNAFPQSLKNSPYKYEQSLPRNRYGHNSTLNLDEDQVIKQSNNSSIIDQSPITFRVEQNHYQNKFQKKTINMQNNKRARIQSQVEKNQVKHVQSQNNNPQYNNVQVQINNGNLKRIRKLQKKLQQANTKILELIRQKMRRVGSSSFHLNRK